MRVPDEDRRLDERLEVTEGQLEWLRRRFMVDIPGRVAEDRRMEAIGDAERLELWRLRRGAAVGDEPPRRGVTGVLQGVPHARSEREGRSVDNIGRLPPEIVEQGRVRVGVARWCSDSRPVEVHVERYEAIGGRHVVRVDGPNISECINGSTPVRSRTSRWTS